MQLVVELPDEYYKALLNSSHVYLTMGGRGNGKTLVSTILVAVANGTPLPKRHGDLKDADRMRAEVFKACMDEHFMPMKFLDCDAITEIIDNAQTIIEADKE